jgi:hypothetical protein
MNLLRSTPQLEFVMEPITEALELLKRQAELEAGLRLAGGIRVTEERELYAVRAQLKRYPHALRRFCEWLRICIDRWIPYPRRTCEICRSDRD